MNAMNNNKETDIYGIEQEEGPRHCLCCGARISYGRKDKKFCNSGCKDEYHNRGKTHKLAAKNKFEHAMERNYRILNDLIKLDIRQVPLADMLAMGFNPNYVTSYSRNAGAVNLACYDISFRQSETRVFNIRRISLSLRQIKNEK